MESNVKNTVNRTFRSVPFGYWFDYFFLLSIISIGKYILGKLIKYYHVSELDGKTLPSKKEFNPKGMAKFHADLEYKFDTIHLQFNFNTDYRVSRPKFAAWTQLQLSRIERVFHKQVVALRLDALLNNDTKEYERLMSIPTEGSFTAYVEE